MKIGAVRAAFYFRAQLKICPTFYIILPDLKKKKKGIDTSCDHTKFRVIPSFLEICALKVLIFVGA